MNKEAQCFTAVSVMTLIGIGLGFTMGLNYKPLPVTPSIKAPIVEAHDKGPLILPDNLSSVEVLPDIVMEDGSHAMNEDGKCLILVRAKDSTPDYIVGDC